MKKLSFLLLLVLCCSLVKAQFTQIAEGPVFPDTLKGFSKILQMKNFTTIYFHVNFDKGVNVQVYEPQYHARTETNIEPAYGSLKAGKVEGIFEMNGNAVMMISERNENEMSLYRLIIDGKTGNLKDEKKIASLKLIPLKKSGTAITVAQPGIYVRKDPTSEHYAVAVTDNYISGSSKRIEITLYDQDNRELSRGHYSSANEKFRYLQFVDMVVIGADNVSALIYGYNIGDGKEKEGDLLFAGLDKKNSIVSFDELYFSSDMVIEQGIAKYDPKTRRIALATTGAVKSDSNKLKAYLGFLDPFTRKLLTNTYVPGGKLTDRYAELFGKGAVYNGLPQDLVVNDNMTYTIVFEEMAVVNEKNIWGQLIKNIAVVTYDEEVELKSSYFIPMEHYISDIAVPLFYQSAREISGQQFWKNNQYKSSVYISDGHNSFILINDIEGNDQAGQTGKLTRFTDTRTADAYFYQLEGKTFLPKRKYVFGKPVEKGDHRPAVFTVYDYDKANNLLVTLKAENDGSHPGVKLVWLQP